jgi:outer membrane protein TolC
MEAYLSAPPVPFTPPAASDGDKPLPISLPSALQLANVQAVDIAAAAERIRVAMAALEQARALWLPTITLGGDYNRHDGKVQDTSGAILDNSRSSLMFGVGTGIGAAAILSLDDAIFARLVARQQLRARQADLQTVSNDTLVAVTDAYFTVQPGENWPERLNPRDGPKKFSAVPRRWFPPDWSLPWKPIGPRRSWRAASRPSC